MDDNGGQENPVITIVINDGERKNAEENQSNIPSRRTAAPSLNRINSGPMSEGYMNEARRTRSVVRADPGDDGIGGQPQTAIAAILSAEENISMFINCLLLVGICFLATGFVLYYYYYHEQNGTKSSNFIFILIYLLLAIGFTSSTSSIIYLIGYFCNRIFYHGRNRESRPYHHRRRNHQADPYRILERTSTGCRSERKTDSNNTVTTDVAITNNHNNNDEYGGESFSFLNVDNLDHIQSTSHLDRDKWTTISNGVDRPQDYLNSFGELPMIPMIQQQPQTSSPKPPKKSSLAPNKRRTIFDSFTFGSNSNNSKSNNNNNGGIHRFSFMSHKSESKSELLANEQEQENMLFNIDQFEINHSNNNLATIDQLDNPDDGNDDGHKQIIMKTSRKNGGHGQPLADERFVIVQFNNVKQQPPPAPTTKTVEVIDQPPPPPPPPSSFPD